MNDKRQLGGEKMVGVLAMGAFIIFIFASGAFIAYCLRTLFETISEARKDGRLRL